MRGRAAPRARQRAPAETKLQAAWSHHAAGRLAEARRIYAEVLSADGDNAVALHLLGVLHAQEKDTGTAVELIRKAVARNPADAGAHNNLGAVLAERGEWTDAIAAYRRAIALKPDHADAHTNLGLALRHVGRVGEAVTAYRKAIALKPGDAGAYCRLAFALRDEGKLDDAVAAYRKAIELKPEDATAHNDLGIVLFEQGKWDDAVAAYHEAIALKPDYAKAHNNLGSVRFNQGLCDEAIVEYRKAIALSPGYANAYANLGGAFRQKGMAREAVAAYRKAIELKPDDAAAHSNLAAALIELARWDEAADAYRRAVEIRPDYGEAYGSLVHVLQRTCDWRGLEAAAARLDALVDAALRNGERPGETPYVNVLRCDDPARNLAIAKARSDDLARRLREQRTRMGFAFARTRRDRIRVAYLSADFHDHATAHLMAGLFALHDRDAFEIHAYSYGPDDSSDYRRRIASGCDAFTDVRDVSFIDAARQIHQAGIDILVDLKGYTREARLEICALKPAPVQVSYLGFPGTTGADFFDYVITDRIVTPEDQAPHYTERFAYLPNCYQVNDGAQPVSEHPYTRADFGLPAEPGFVFSCFNHTHKIEPVMWDCWMRILKTVEGSVLWLLGGIATATRNLKHEAQARGVDPGRIIFASRLPKPEHLARLKLSGLSLDTRIYNAHTTASDALWAGVPLVTLQGKHFASRVASSLLATVGMPELITHSLDDYEALAVQLARAPDELASLRDKLSRNRRVTPLFDTARFARDLERAYRRMWDIHLAGEPPRIIFVEDAGGLLA